MTQDRKTRPDGTRTDETGRTVGNAREEGGDRAGQKTGEDAERGAQAGRSGKNVSNEPLPDLSDQGGVEPLQEDPGDYNDRTRDRELDEG